MASPDINILNPFDPIQLIDELDLPILPPLQSIHQSPRQISEHFHQRLNELNAPLTSNPIQHHVQPIARSQHTRESFHRRLLELTHGYQSFVFWGRPIEQLIAIAKLIAPVYNIINSPDISYNPRSNAVNIITIPDIIQPTRRQLEEVASLGNMLPFNPPAKCVYVTELTEDRIRQWSTLQRLESSVRIIRFKDPIPVEILHDCVDF